MLWIDSPVGTGYSYVNNPSGYATNEKIIAEELYTALYTFFFTLHPEYSKLPFYIFGILSHTHSLFLSLSQHIFE
jgi:carboxypeptidase C (cathepsin A)